MRKLHSKTCGQCGQVFHKTSITESAKRFYAKKFCSLRCMYAAPSWRKAQSVSHLGQSAWNKGVPLSEEQKGKMRAKMVVIAKERGFGKWMLGKKASVESRRKNSEAMKKRVAEGRHNFYIDGRNKENQRIRHSLEYKLWREAVFNRDNWTCVECGARSGNGKRITLHADHIKPFSKYPKLRLALSNGRTLCVPCHELTPTYKGKALTC